MLPPCSMPALASPLTITVTSIPTILAGLPMAFVRVTASPERPIEHRMTGARLPHGRGA